MNNQPKRSGCKRILTTLFVVLLLVVMVLVGGYVWFNNQVYSIVNKDGTSQKFSVESGDSLDTIAGKLQSQNLIGNKDVFAIYARISKLSGDFKAGDFSISPAMSIAEIARSLTVVPTKPTTWVTIKEGLYYKEVVTELLKQTAGKATAINETDLLAIIENPDNNIDKLTESAASFLQKFKTPGKNLEGFLYPETYNIALDVTPGELISLLINTLESKLGKDNLAKVVASKYSFYQIMTIASIVEREANNPADYALVAGIFYNRLDRGMRLDADATTLYGLNRRTPVPTKSELADTKNLYNTRALAGLTPTPICNPGLAAIVGALEPTKSDYLYYLTGKDGKMYYAKTYAEHNRNINLYL